MSAMLCLRSCLLVNLSFDDFADLCLDLLLVVGRVSFLG